MNNFVKNNNLLIGSTKEDQPDFPYDPNNLALVYDTSLEPENNTVSVPLNGTVNCTIDWGDGSSDSYTTTGFKTHTYASSGVYVVQISGLMTQLNYGTGTSNTNNKAKLTRCLSFGNVGLTILNNAFRNCSNFIQCPTSLPTTSAVTNCATAFLGCSQFNDSSIAQWNTETVTNMSNMLQNCTVFNQNIGSWNTAKVTNMNAMLQNCIAFNQNIGSWNTSEVTSMNGMFQSCAAFNQNIGSWNTAKVTSMNGMFQNCTVFNQNIGSWNTAKVTNMSNMFRNCATFNQNIGSWNTSEVTNMDNMFLDCKAFNQNIGSWNTAKVRRMSGMFSGTENTFAQDISGWDIRNVIVMSGMFTNNAWGTSNYDAALIAWSQLISPQSNVSWGVGTNKYSSAAASARNVLTNTYNWVISDGGLL